ncbi:MAG: MFS transporter [Candidatus Hermodarchaeota archaeon]
MAEIETEKSRHSFWTYVSFGSYNILWTIPTAAMNVFMYYYYHTVVGLDPIFIFIVVAINTVWAGLNDPLIGWLTDKNFKWTRKWGRRFPWVLVGFIPQSLSLVMIFSAPHADPANPIPAMLWFLVSLLLFDLFITLVDLHVSMLRADKFRMEKERRKYAGAWGFFDMVAQVLGMMLPPLLIFFGKDNPLSYTVMALIIAGIAIIFGLTSLPGLREDKIVIDRYYSKEYGRLNILKGLKSVLKTKSFMSLYAAYVSFLTATTIMTNMVPYLVTFILRSEDPDVMVIFFAMFLLGALISIPIWLKILKKVNNNKKTYLIGSFLLCVLIVPLAFFQTDLDLMIIMFFAGMGNGSVWTIGMPVLYSNVQDDYIVRTGGNQKGILVGTWAVIGLITAFIDEALITLVFTLTGFRGGIETYLDLLNSGVSSHVVIAGIRILLGFVPALVLLTGTLIFWKYYPLTQDKVLENKAKLLELGL